MAIPFLWVPSAPHWSGACWLGGRQAVSSICTCNVRRHLGSPRPPNATLTRVGQLIQPLESDGGSTWAVSSRAGDGAKEDCGYSIANTRLEIADERRCRRSL